MHRLFLVPLVLWPAVFCAETGTDKVSLGKYLVEEVARCQDCHTQRLETGELDRSKWLKGATLDIQPAKPVKNWHTTSPDLTSSGRLWQRWGEAALVNFLESGKTPKGGHSDPPMPTYTLKRADAEAIVEYLKTLK